MYAQVRPCKSYPGVRSRFQDVDLIIIRENTEDLYAGIEYEQGTEDAEELIRWIESKGGTLPPPRRRHLDQADLGHGHAPHLRVRVRLCAQERPPQDHGRPQGEHHEVHGRALASRCARGRCRELRHRVRRSHRRQHVHAARPAARGVRHARAAEPLRRRALRSVRRHDRRPRPRARGELRRGRRGVRADARLRTEVRGPEQGQPDGAAAVRNAHAPPPRGAHRRRPARARDRRGDRRGQERHLRHEAESRDDPTAVGTSEVADAIIEKLEASVPA